jgi:hypothetical protein
MDFMQRGIKTHKPSKRHRRTSADHFAEWSKFMDIWGDVNPCDCRACTKVRQWNHRTFVIDIGLL